MRYRLNSDGTKTPIAGRGRAEYGASTIRKTPVTIPQLNKGTHQAVTVTFATPMPDTDYLISLEPNGASVLTFDVFDKATTGFRVMVSNNSNEDTYGAFTLNTVAFKLYTDTEYNNILTAIPSDASASNKLVTENEVNANKSFGTPVDIKGYDIANNMYTAPSDGLFVIRNRGSESGYFYINTVIGGSTVTLIAENGGYKGQSVFAKKGTRVFCTFDTTITASNMQVVFIPFV